MQILQCETFAGRANETFDVGVGVSSVPMTLIQVQPLPVQAYAGMMRAPFSLTFRSESPVLLPQQIYRMNNATLGALDIFLVPVARDVSGILYQAVFN
ncbi:MAG: hypothetical protein EON87_05065 [Brevundimonas sp.]|nr:MAG: hypothetical protein EON87_05065 [Brevundimonas sp.]